MKKTVLNIEGMTCSACSNGLEKYLNRQEGIKEASVNLVLASAMIEYDEKLTIKDLNRFIEEAGFKSLGEERKQSSSKTSLITLVLFALLAIILMYISMGHMINAPLPQFLNMMTNPKRYGTIIAILTIPFLFYGWDIIRNGVKNIIHKMPNMDSLVGIGVLVNFIYSLWNLIQIFRGNHEAVHSLYFEASGMIILFVKLGRYIDRNNKQKAVETVRNLVTITPKNGTVIKDGKEIVLTINEIKKGDIVACKPGEKISVDGVVTKGKTHTDESFITGESKAVSKDVGDKVIAGSTNYDGYIEYVAERIGKNSSISGIVDLVVQATNTKAPIARFADRVSGVFVPIIFGIAVLSFILNLMINNLLSEAIKALVSVLVVACPCALGLATPLAMVISIGRCSKNGILVKSSNTLEAINNIDTIVFDKTGTLTKGKLSIVNSQISKENMQILKSLEAKSDHPVAKAISEFDNNELNQILDITEFENVAGYGIKGKIDGKTYYAGNSKFIENIIINFKNKNSQNSNKEILKTLSEYQKLETQYLKEGNTIVFLFNNKEILGIVGLADEIKSDAINIISTLEKYGKKIFMLTGDNDSSAKAIADKLKIKNVVSNVTPKEKLEKIKELNHHKNCMMVGDGINDSPALKTATIGVSVNGGTDISQDSSDIILLNDNLNVICDIFTIGKRTIRVIKQNLFWALFYNVCMIPLATGLLPIYINPMIASAAMTLSSLTVVLNSLRLIK